MRDNLFRHVQRLSVEYFDKNNTGELLARVRDDVDRIWDILGFAGMLILEGLICIMMAMISMVKLDLPLTLVSVAILPFVAGSQSASKKNSTVSTMRSARKTPS